MFKPALRLRSIERIFAETLVPLREEGLTVTVSGQQSPAGLSARVLLGNGAGNDAEERARSLLRGFPVEYEVEIAG